MSDTRRKPLHWKKLKKQLNSSQLIFKKRHELGLLAGKHPVSARVHDGRIDTSDEVWGISGKRKAKRIVHKSFRRWSDKLLQEQFQEMD